jgi:3-hydroxyacyl-CoA dehydrogenase
MNTIRAEDVRKVACVGAGTIGSGWAAYFLSQDWKLLPLILRWMLKHGYTGQH